MGSFLFACDSFKGTLSSARSSELLAEEARAFFPEADFRSLEVADGGEGTVDAIVASLGGQRVSLLAGRPPGPPGRGHLRHAAGGARRHRDGGRLLACPSSRLASATPRKTSTFGTGQMILDCPGPRRRDISLAHRRLRHQRLRNGRHARAGRPLSRRLWR